MERGFNGMEKEKWQSYVVRGNEITKLKDKLKLLESDLKVWNRNVYGNLHTIKRNILQEIETLDCHDVNDNSLGSVRVGRLELMSRLRETDRKLDSLISQKARMNWLKHGGSCTKFYHSSLRWRRHRNEIKGVEVGGQCTEEPSTARIEAKKLFENRFKATNDLELRLDAVDFKKLTLKESLNLIYGFTEEEIKEAVWQCEGSKSPDPDGFNFNFIKKSWEYIKDEIVKALALFHETCTIPKGCNASFIALVPKVRDPSKLEQYRPISLVGAIYKVIAKVLAGKIKKVLASIIDDNQSVFLKDKGMLDSVLMANEVVEDLRRSGRAGLCLKVDFEKA